VYLTIVLPISVQDISKAKRYTLAFTNTREKELIVGVGAFKHIDLDVQYIGSAFKASNNNGSFKL